LEQCSSSLGDIGKIICIDDRSPESTFPPP
jgi:hypothetical protein